MKIIKGDKVLIIAGKDRSKISKVIKAFPQDKKILVENVNVVKKAQRPQKQGQKGQMVSLPKPINVSNAKLVCPKCGKATRVGYSAVRNENGEGARICKKCKAEV